MALTREKEKELMLQLRAASAVSESIWETLQDEYRKPLLKYAKYVTRTTHDAEDMAQIAWVNFWNFRAKFDPDQKSVLGFLRLLVARAAASHYGGKAITVSMDDDADNGPVRPVKDVLFDGKLSPEELAELRQRYLLILKILSELSNPMHLKLAFGFLRFLEEESGRIVSEWSPQTLAVMEKAFEERFPSAQSRETAKAFEAFNKSLKEPVDWEHVKAARAGSTRFGIYFEVKPEEAKKQKVQAWADTIRRKIIIRLAIILPE